MPYPLPVLLSRLALTTGLFLLGSCAPLLSRPATSAPLDTAGPPPDVVILAVSGRCGPPCLAPRDNWDYLAARGTVDALAQTIEARGYRVQVASYSDHAAADYWSVKVGRLQHGYAALLRDFNQMQAAWFSQSNPKPVQPRLVLLGHSHGAVWLHYLVQTHPEVPVALQIDLDSLCTSWRLDHQAELRQAKLGGQVPALPDPAAALNTCNPVKLPSGKSLRSKDVVWLNVAANLEVQSKRLPARTSNTGNGGFFINYLFETTPNQRPDGSKQGIQFYLSRREDHSTITYPSSDAIQWVLQKVSQLVGEWPKTGS